MANESPSMSFLNQSENNRRKRYDHGYNYSNNNGNGPHRTNTNGTSIMNNSSSSPKTPAPLPSSSSSSLPAQVQSPFLSPLAADTSNTRGTTSYSSSFPTTSSSPLPSSSSPISKSKSNLTPTSANTNERRQSRNSSSGKKHSSKKRKPIIEQTTLEAMKVEIERITPTTLYVMANTISNSPSVEMLHCNPVLSLSEVGAGSRSGSSLKMGKLALPPYASPGPIKIRSKQTKKLFGLTSSTKTVTNSDEEYKLTKKLEIINSMTVLAQLMGSFNTKVENWESALVHLKTVFDLCGKEHLEELQLQEKEDEDEATRIRNSNINDSSSVGLKFDRHDSDRNGGGSKSNIHRPNLMKKLALGKNRKSKEKTPIKKSSTNSRRRGNTGGTHVRRNNKFTNPVVEYYQKIMAAQLENKITWRTKTSSFFKQIKFLQTSKYIINANRNGGGEEEIRVEQGKESSATTGLNDTTSFAPIHHNLQQKQQQQQQHQQHSIPSDDSELSITEHMDSLLRIRTTNEERKARARERENNRRIEKEMKEREEQIEREKEEQRIREEEAKKAASKLLRPLTEEELATVNKAIYGNGPDNDVVAKSDADSVLRRSMRTLQPCSWLNDEVIHYFYLMLSKRDEEICKNEEGRRRSHFFKSFFLTKLFDEGGTEQYRYANVKRWSKRVHGKDIFELDKIFFPCNIRNTHWCCAVIFIQEKRIQFYDSMHGEGMHYIEGLMQYLKDEWKAKKGGELPDVDKWRLVPCESDVPHQENGYDCGVFTCMFADFLSVGRPLSFNQEHITQCRERIALSIMKGVAIT